MLKSDFILSLYELIIGGKNGLESVEKTINDRCVMLVLQVIRVADGINPLAVF